MKFKIIGLLFLMSISFTLSAQTQTDLQVAFKQSYIQEGDGSYSEAIQSLIKYYEDDSYEINLRLAWLNYLAGSYTESISYYNRSIQIRPLSIEARLGLTYPASAIGNWDQVVTQYKDILKLAPSHYTANLRLGQIYLNRKEYKKASDYLELLINQHPFTYDVMINTAWNYYYEGKLREAKILFQKVLLIYSGDESALLGLSKIK